MEMLSMSEDEIGRASHEAWKRWRVEMGYPDHALAKNWTWQSYGGVMKRRCDCGHAEEDHLEDMIDWADLRPEKREKYIRQGMAGYEARQADFQARVNILFEDMRRSREYLGEGIRLERARAEAAEARVAELEAERDRAAALREAVVEYLAALDSAGSVRAIVGQKTALWLMNARARLNAALATDPARGAGLREAAKRVVTTWREYEENPSVDFEYTISLPGEALESLVTDPSREAKEAQ